MSKSVTLQLPETLYEKISQRANLHRSLEDLLLESIHLQFDALWEGVPLEDVLAALAHYSDEALWRVVEYRLPYIQRQRRRELVAKSGLSAEEQTELEMLVTQYDRFVALRSEALLLLKQRGVAVDTYLKEREM